MPPDRSSAHSLPPEQVERLHEALRRAVRSQCPPWLADRADDVTQQAMLRVLRALERRDPDAELPAAYVWRTAHSALVDEIRKQRRRREESLDEAAPAALRARAPGPLRASSGREIGRAIGECLRQLVRPRRLAVTLYLQGHTVPESARLLRYGGKKTENLVYRGLADLRRCLAEKGHRP